MSSEHGFRVRLPGVMRPNEGEYSDKVGLLYSAATDDLLFGRGLQGVLYMITDVDLQSGLLHRFLDGQKIDDVLNNLQFCADGLSLFLAKRLINRVETWDEVRVLRQHLNKFSEPSEGYLDDLLSKRVLDLYMSDLRARYLKK